MTQQEIIEEFTRCEVNKKLAAGNVAEWFAAYSDYFELENKVKSSGSTTLQIYQAKEEAKRIVAGLLG